ncbi:hypothetical protein [Actinomyces qiguomingii]|uniref:hypothetical protein n=1 Tax=Actinomyces qiguomingii TaxID=2057800 RepID=UPI000CA025D2|nr:hypothetical protein [Actinomyces qiguomingii]
MSGDSRSCLSGSLLRGGVGLIAIAIGLRWIVELLRSAWMWLAGAGVVVGVIAAVVVWWRGRW